METEVKLTKLAGCAGCGAKVGAGTLVHLLEGFRTHTDPRLIVGYDKSDDASVYVLDENTALVQTTDFFPPIVDDPFLYGQIAAANALSDVYAMGGEPKLALNIMCLAQSMDDHAVQEILRGGYDKAYEAGAIITGGHTIQGAEPIYGLAVSGFVHPKKVLTNSGAKPGDVLILTKPLGVGVLTTAAKADLVEKSVLDRIYRQMAALNKAARDVMVKYPVHSCTDVTGFSLLGHSFEMAQGQQTASDALENTGLTLQTGENVATGDQTLKISMPGTETVTTEQVENLLDSLNENYPDNQFAQLSLSNVSAAMGTKFLQKSLVAVVFALVLILLYIALRFKNIGGLTGGMMAVLALVNDLMVVFGTFVLLRTALDGNFIAAMLTILGYSINDTVVVYDRIRENRALMGKKGSFEELVNQSVNQSARRTLITTITTVMALGVMCIVAKLYGLDSIFTFAFPLMMGMISGVYTSLCVSTSAWVLWSERKPKTKA